MTINRLVIFSAISVFVLSCSSSRKTTGSGTAAISKLRFINEYVVPSAMPFKGTIVGGLSGIDRDAANDLYYLIADDRSDKSPAHFYTAKKKE